MMARNATRLTVFGLGALLGPAVWAQAAPGTQQSATADSGQLEEVLVTARGRQENLQEVPLSIAVFTSDEIASGGLNDIRDLAKLAPNLVVYSGTGRSDATALVVRGLSPSTSDERYQGLSTFIDGLYVSGQVTGIDFGEVEQVEVIYGPQGVKFGRATYSGAINYITRTPSSNELRSKVRTGFSSHGSGSDMSYRLGGSVEFPLKTDTMWLSLYANKARVGARVKDADSGGPVGEEKSVNLGATLFAKFGESTSVRLRFTDDRDDDSVGLLYIAQPTDWGANAPGEFSYSSIVAGMAVTGRWINGAVPDPILGLTGQNVNLIASIDPRLRDNGYPDVGGRDRRRQMVSLQLKTELAGGVQLSYSGARYSQEYWAYEDFFYRSRTKDPIFAPLGRSVAATAGAANIIGFKEEFANVSHQIRIASDAGQRLRWSAGLFYFQEDDRNFTGANIGRTAFQNSPTVFAATGAFAQYAGLVNQDGRTRGFEGIENRAVFAGVEYDVTAKLIASLEGRYAREEVSYDSCVFCNTINVVDREESRSAFDPRVIVKYRFTDDVNGYLQYATGVKSGRYNTALVQAYRFAEPEELTAYELGMKTTLFDRRLRLNGALFYQTIDKQQLLATFVNPNCTPLPNVLVGCVQPSENRTFTGAGTAGNSEIFGLDVQAQWRVTDRFTLNANGGYSRHEWVDQFALQSGLSDVLLFPAGETLIGRTTINTPRVTAAVAGEYVMPFMSGPYELAFRADAVHTGKKYLDQANIAFIDAVTRFNLRAALQRDDGDLSVAAFVRDVTDEKASLGGGIAGTSTCNFNEPSSIQRCYTTSIPRGREIGVEMTFRF